MIRNVRRTDARPNKYFWRVRVNMVNVVCLLLGADLVIDGNFKLLYITYAFSSVNKKKFKFNKQCSGAQSSFTQKLFHTKRYAIQLFLFYLLLI